MYHESVDISSEQCSEIQSQANWNLILDNAEDVWISLSSLEAESSQTCSINF